MKNLYSELPNGYQESIQKGLDAVRYFSRNMSFGTGTDEERIGRLNEEIKNADAIVIGAGAGLSTAAGLTYSGARFERYFFDFAKRYRYLQCKKGKWKNVCTLYVHTCQRLRKTLSISIL